ncbi:MAG: hypothetical protein M3R72_07395 [Bacteroidota bacterium]|nr:hypothetical protein [Bacteroidota bacterium]
MPNFFQANMGKNKRRKSNLQINSQSFFFKYFWLMLSIHSYPGFLLLIALRYFFVAGIAWLIWYVLLRDKMLYKKIQQRFPKEEDYKRELGYSLLTIFVFALIPSLLLLTPI